jgi:hypothetical protein
MSFLPCHVRAFIPNLLSEIDLQTNSERIIGS